MKNLSEIQSIVRAHALELHQRFGIANLAVLGSVVRGEAKEKSDVDILAVFDRSIGLLALCSAVRTAPSSSYPEAYGFGTTRRAAHPRRCATDSMLDDELSRCKKKWIIENINIDILRTISKEISIISPKRFLHI